MNHIFKYFLSFVFIFFLIHKIYSQEKMRIIEKFSANSSNGNKISGWEEKSFLGHTKYSIVKHGENYLLHARSDSAASGLYKKIKYDVQEWPWLSWRWKVDKLPEKGDVHFKETDDYGARVYVVFSHFLKWKTKTISYIWARKLPKGEYIPNSWLPKNAAMVAVESGTDSLGRWITEKRNVYQDFKQIFGEEPPEVGAIAIMSDSDNTGGRAEAFYDDFMLLRDEN